MEFLSAIHSRKKSHFLVLSILFFVAIFYNFLPQAFSGISLSQQLSSDAEYHIVHWQKYAKKYEDNYIKDFSFNLDIRPSGELFFDHLFVRIADSFSIKNENLSIFISVLALGIFLSGVYALSYFVLQDAFLGFIISLGSIIPTFALGGATWGFSTLGYIPKELALSFIIWLLFLFLYGKKYHILKLNYLVFLIAGLLANWYPVGFFHFIAVLLFTDVILERKILKEHLFYTALFMGGAGFAIFDVLSKASATTPPDLGILHIRYVYMLLSPLSYGIFHYLRRVILYLVWICFLFFIHKRFLKEKERGDLSFWSALFVSSGVLMTLGIFIEQYTIYAKFLFSRTSVYFILASMLISTIVLLDVSTKYLPKKLPKKLVLGLFLFILFFIQSSIPSVYRSLRNLSHTKDQQKTFLAAIETLRQHTSSTALILAEGKYSNQIRAYGGRAVYSSWKDGGITLLDGTAGRKWYERFLDNERILHTAHITQMVQFSKEQGISAIFVKKDQVPDLEGTFPYIKAGDFRIIPIPQE